MLRDGHVKGFGTVATSRLQLLGLIGLLLNYVMSRFISSWFVISVSGIFCEQILLIIVFKMECYSKFVKKNLLWNVEKNLPQMCTIAIIKPCLLLYRILSWESCNNICPCCWCYIHTQKMRLTHSFILKFPNNIQFHFSEYEWSAIRSFNIIVTGIH